MRRHALTTRSPSCKLGAELCLVHGHRRVIADLRSSVRRTRGARRGGLRCRCRAVMAAVAPIATLAPTATVATIASVAPVTMSAGAPATTAVAAVAAIASAARATTATVARLGGTSRPVQERNTDDPEKHGNGKDKLSIHRSILSSSCERPIQFSHA